MSESINVRFDLNNRTTGEHVRYAQSQGNVYEVLRGFEEVFEQEWINGQIQYMDGQVPAYVVVDRLT